VLVRLELLRRCRADALGRGIRRSQAGMLGLELEQFAKERVVLRVGNRRRILDVILPVRLLDEGAEVNDFLFRTTSSGVPLATIVPPRSPPSGPMSIR
jgi:hypothetical protein